MCMRLRFILNAWLRAPYYYYYYYYYYNSRVYNQFCLIFTAGRLRNRVLRGKNQSTCLSVCQISEICKLWQTKRTYCWYSNTIRKSNSYNFLMSTVVGVNISFYLKFWIKMTQPSKKRWLQQIFVQPYELPKSSIIIVGCWSWAIQCVFTVLWIKLKLNKKVC